MKDSYDPLDWNKGGTSGGSVKQYSSADYDNFAKNPTYRSDALGADEFQGDFQSGAAQQAESFTQADYDRYAQNPTYRSDYYEGAPADDGAYQQDYYQDGYYQDGQQDYYQDGYYQDNSYQDAYVQQDSTGANSYQTYGQAQPTKYSQEDYDNMAKNPSYLSENNPNRMGDDEFHNMILKQKKREFWRDQRDNLLIRGSFSARSADSVDISKDSLLYILSLGFGAALARLLSLPFWVYPIFAAGIGLAVTAFKAFIIDSEGKEDALKRCITPGVILGIAIGLSVYMKSKGF